MVVVPPAAVVPTAVMMTERALVAAAMMAECMVLAAAVVPGGKVAMPARVPMPEPAVVLAGMVVAVAVAAAVHLAHVRAAALLAPVRRRGGGQHGGANEPADEAGQDLQMQHNSLPKGLNEKSGFSRASAGGLHSEMHEKTHRAGTMVKGANDEQMAFLAGCRRGSGQDHVPCGKGDGDQRLRRGDGHAEDGVGGHLLVEVEDGGLTRLRAVGRGQFRP